MKIKQNYNISKAKSIVLGMLAGLFALAASCERDDPMPQPTPGPEPTPVVPTKEVTLDWDWGSFDNDIATKISKDTIKKYADMEDVKFVFLNILNEDGGSLSSTFRTIGFHNARDTLQTRFDISDKVRGSGIIYVNGTKGAQVPDDVNATGMHISDSAWYAEKDYTIKRYDPSSQKSR